MTTSPLFSLALPVLNGMPHLKRAIGAIRRQTCRDFELIVQDGGSIDGRLAYLRSLTDIPRIDIVSAPDSGLAQAWGRAMERCTGKLLVFVSCDETLDDDALATFVRWRTEYPDAVAVYGAMRMVDEDYREITTYVPPPFDLVRFMKCEIFASVAGFFDIERIGPHFYYDQSLKTCPDYDFFIRLGAEFGAERLVALDQAIISARWDRSSMSFRTETYDQFLADKLFILNRFLDSQEDTPAVRALRRDAGCGVCLWLAESTMTMENYTPLFKKYLGLARDIDPQAYEVALFCVDSDVVDRPTKEAAQAIAASAEKTSANLLRFLVLLMKLDEFERNAI